jgi:hypothetical protein
MISPAWAVKLTGAASPGAFSSSTVSSGRSLALPRSGNIAPSSRPSIIPMTASTSSSDVSAAGRLLPLRKTVTRSASLNTSGKRWVT